MDVAGAEALRLRIAQQEHWRSARAVRLGLQPSVDPDGHALESFAGATRLYHMRLFKIVAGRPAMVTRQIRKRLVEGAWCEELIDTWWEELVDEPVRRVA